MGNGQSGSDRASRSSQSAVGGIWGNNLSPESLTIPLLCAEILPWQGFPEDAVSRLVCGLAGRAESWDWDLNCSLKDWEEIPVGNSMFRDEIIVFVY